MKSEAALRVVTPLLEEPVADPAELDDPPPSRRDRSARGRNDQPFATVEGLAKKKFRWRRPRHTLKGRQTESEVKRVGRAEQLCKQQAEAGDIVLLYGDESEVLDASRSRPRLGEVGGLAGAGAGQAQRLRRRGRLITSRANSSSIRARSKCSSDFIAHLEQTRLSLWTAAPATGQAGRVGRGHGLIPHQQTPLAARPLADTWLTVEAGRQRRPEMNEIEPVCDR